MFSESETYTDVDHTAIATIGGSGRKTGGTKLTTLNATDMSTTIVHVDVAVDSEQRSQLGWDNKKRVSMDAESFEPSKQVLAEP